MTDKIATAQNILALECQIEELEREHSYTYDVREIRAIEHDLRRLKIELIRVKSTGGD
jgi:hypothetical protein